MSNEKPIRWINKKTPKVSQPMAAKIRHMYFVLGMKQHDIAAHFELNQGRVSEVVNGHRFPEAPQYSGPTLFEH